MLDQRLVGRHAKPECLLGPFVRLPDLGNDWFTRRVWVEQVDPIAWFYGPVSVTGQISDHTRVYALPVRSVWPLKWMLSRKILSRKVGRAVALLLKSVP